MLMTMAPKSVTSPIAMLVAEQIGGVAALAAVLHMSGGVSWVVGVLRMLLVVVVRDAGVAGSGRSWIRGNGITMGIKLRRVGWWIMTRSRGRNKSKLVFLTARVTV